MARTAWTIYKYVFPVITIQQHFSSLDTSTAAIPGFGRSKFINMYQISNIYVLAGFGTIGGALFGFDVSSMSAWLAADQYLDYFNSPNSDLQGGITASMSGGSFIGALCAGSLADRWGRKIALQIACLIFVVGTAVVCSSQDVGQLIAGR